MFAFEQQFSIGRAGREQKAGQRVLALVWAQSLCQRVPAGFPSMPRFAAHPHRAEPELHSVSPPTAVGHTSNQS